jgi:hypothetical protein
MIEREYDPALLAFIVDASPTDLETIKEQLVEVASKIESDEKAYIYHSNHNGIPRWPGAAVGSIANLKPENVKVSKAIKKILELWSYEDEDAARYLFIITDSLDSISAKRIQMLTRKDKNQAWQHQPTKFVVITLDQMDEIEGIETFTTKPQGIAAVIRHCYKGTELPIIAPPHEPLDLEALQREKDKYDKEEADSEEIESPEA